jgi:hypothetical protein
MQGITFYYLSNSGISGSSFNEIDFTTNILVRLTIEQFYMQFSQNSHHNTFMTINKGKSKVCLIKQHRIKTYEGMKM